MLTKLKKWATIAILVSPTGFTMLVLGCMMEISYRLLTAFDILEMGQENFAIGTGFIVFIALLLYKLTVYKIKMKMNKR
jgi:hypothetical protein